MFEYNLKKISCLQRIVISFVLYFGFVANVFAVDGYKGLKFGMSEKEILASNICGLAPVISPIREITIIACENLSFNGDKKYAEAYFIDGVFLRFAIFIDDDEVVAVIKALAAKYGQPSYRSSQKEFEAVDQYPNREASIAFDNNTVNFLVKSLEDYSLLPLIYYTSNTYDSLLLRKQQKSIDGDI
jgi:hypothetical protein